ncbi:Glycosyltransferase family 10 (fucosyltransferase) [Agrobacterium sp. DSM 25558]|uniref:glycosyltransferase family 10 domain-containing protein n=1 Tax=Agrobacterium sp. DSM 25558 TaxID=1907665 RepID=UPI000972521E|nr:glycosyltransferase family 10 [Agrobacterium sp. DSM 25558]SCX25526.1 Glycosyltransferase family 10 (fucosyltransferase) [Agrobacterium sp. DSM 25558]
MSVKAGFVSSSPEWHWERQLPDGITTWRDVEFVFSGDFQDCDVVFVFDAIPTNLAGIQPKRSVFVASEPRSIKQYDAGFLSQFDTILTTDRSTQHPNVKIGQVGLPWHIGAWDDNGDLRTNPMNYKTFESFRPAKTKSISVVSSSKAYTEGHRARLAFVQRLKDYFGDEVDVFGRNINGFGDKTQVLNDYRYHIAIENSCYEHYWTEKLSDPYLSLTYPIYYGCPNISDYVPENSLTKIDIEDAERSIQIIKRLIESDVAENATPALEEARSLVLQDNNLFNILSNQAKLETSSAGNRTTLECERYFIKPKYRWKRKTRKLLDRLSGGRN